MSPGPFLFFLMLRVAGLAAHRTGFPEGQPGTSEGDCGEILHPDLMAAGYFLRVRGNNWLNERAEVMQGNPRRDF